jgi:hypothetical protein
MRSLEDLLQEARHGRLTDVELEYISNRIKYFDPDKEDDDTLFRLLLIIEEIGMISHPGQIYFEHRSSKIRNLIEPYLEYPRDDYISAMALSILCDWGFTEDYLDVIKKFIQGVEWDDGDCAFCAMGEAGGYLNKKTEEEIEEKDIELAQLLKSVIDDPTRDEVDRDAAYKALARASGLSWDEILDFPNLKEEDLKEDFDVQKWVQGE